uniref:Uncharacterized protein n=1 Tax=Anguilla anguilla TaxID=7936 RepID=A0A0E9UQE8_ANGAN
MGGGMCSISEAMLTSDPGTISLYHRAAVAVAT